MESCCDIFLSVIGLREPSRYPATKTWISELDPRVKILSILSLLVFILLARGFISLFILAFFLIVFALAIGCSLLSFFRSLRPFWWLLAAVFLLNLTLTSGRILIQFWWFTLTYQGVVRGTFLSLKLVLMISAAHVLLLSSTPWELSSGLVRLLSPFRLLRLPVSSIGTISSLALRFIPTVGEETRKILSAQRARGGRGYGLMERIREALSLLPTLLSSSLRRGEGITIAMEAKGYRPDLSGTKQRRLRLGDCFTLGAVLLAGSAALTVGLWLS